MTLSTKKLLLNIKVVTSLSFILYIALTDLFNSWNITLHSFFILSKRYIS